MEKVVLLADEASSDGGFPAEGWGIGAFIILIALLAITLAFGKGRPHS
ncbi:hypothetical protein [Phytoactinopolyspora limicola]|nr:hypothetical protein [Phytoactinopolyspora limicola]